VPVVVHPDARAILERYYRERGGLTDARLRMARTPEGAELIANATSGAPGIRIANVFVLAGVPHIAAAMLAALDGQLEGGRPVVSVTVGAFAPESEVADMLREAEQANPGVAVGNYPFFREGRVGANFVVRAVELDLADQCAREIAEALRAAGYKPVDGGI
jgi:molybdopterin-biosynthesis enzyme MoeA-like protein